MSLMKNGRLFGRINVVDFTVGLAIVLGVSGTLLVQSGKLVTSGQEVEGESDILETIQIPRLTTLDPNMFKAGDKTSITIRNQPRGEVKITNVKMSAPQITLPGSGGKGVAVSDVSQKDSYDYLLTLQDHAKITKDGYVAEGVKVKVGLPVELEGFKYRVFGKIVNVEATK